MSDPILDRIRDWEADGLIDPETAARLRASEEHADAAGDGGSLRAAGTFFGPGVALTEAFAYVGSAFVLAAWFVLILRTITEASLATGQWLQVALSAVPAAVLFVLGIALHSGSARQARAAGVCFYLSAAFVASGVATNATVLADTGPWATVIGTLAGLVAAAAYRWLHPALLTQFALVSAIVAAVGAWLEAVRSVLEPIQVLPAASGIGSAVVVTLLWIATWLACAILLGVIGLIESRTGTPDADRRAALTRFFAGIVAVVGVAIAVTRSIDEGFGNVSRVVEPWLGDLIVLGVSLVVVERAVRREASAYVFAAALGLIIVLSDMNATYFSPAAGVEVALLVEGLALLAVAFGAERLNRRIGRDGDDDTDTAADDGDIATDTAADDGDIATEADEAVIEPPAADAAPEDPATPP